MTEKMDPTLTMAKGRRPGELVATICQQCKKEFTYRHYGPVNGIKRQFCSQRCRVHSVARRTCWAEEDVT